MLTSKLAKPLLSRKRHCPYHNHAFLELRHVWHNFPQHQGHVQAALMELKDAWQGTARQMQQQEAAQVQQVGQALQQLREDLQKQLPSGKLKAIESKLAALEGSVLSAGATQCAHHCVSCIQHAVYVAYRMYQLSIVP